MIPKSVERSYYQLSRKEKDILKIAYAAIYFDDNSDFRTALWEIATMLVHSDVWDLNRSELYELFCEGDDK